MVDPDLDYSYVLARVDLAQQHVVISQAGRSIQTYDYSLKTVGAWAADDQDYLVFIKNLTHLLAS